MQLIKNWIETASQKIHTSENTKQFPLLFQVDHTAVSKVLKDLTSQRKLNSHFLEDDCCVASVSLQTGYPTAASVSHFVINRNKQVLVLSVETDYMFPLAEKMKAFLADPSAL